MAAPSDLELATNEEIIQELLRRPNFAAVLIYSQVDLGGEVKVNRREIQRWHCALTQAISDDDVPVLLEKTLSSLRAS